jgi:single-strand DNA-binding protein
MAGVNKVIILGNLGKDPEMRYTPSGKPVTNFSVAVSRTVGQEGNRREETEWFNIVAFDRQAEIANQYLVKGGKVYIEGRLQTRSWEDTEGQKHYRVEVIVQQLQLLGSRADAGERVAAAAPSNDSLDDDLPF